MRKRTITRPAIQKEDRIEIPLTKGLVAIVDLVDSDLAHENNWCAQPVKGGYHYAGRRKGYKPSRNELLHVLIFQRVLGRELTSGELVDHVDRDTLNNRRSNLRLATKAQNAVNSKIRRDNQSGYKGVSWAKYANRWRSTIGSSGKQIHLGYFDSPEEAFAAYSTAAKEIYGDYANLDR